MGSTTIAASEASSSEPRDEVFEEAVATMAAILNHEICQPLSTILSNAQVLLQTAAHGDPDMRRRLESIEAAARKIRRSARDLATASNATHDIVDC